MRCESYNVQTISLHPTSVLSLTLCCATCLTASSQSALCAQSVSPPSAVEYSNAENVVWRAHYPIDYATRLAYDTKIDNDAIAPSSTRGVSKSRLSLDEKRLYVFPVQNPPAPNDAVILLDEFSSLSTGHASLFARDNDATKPSSSALQISLHQHAAMKASDLSPRALQSMTSDEWLRQLGRTPTREEINVFRKSRHKPTSRGVWLFRDTQEDSFARFASASQYKIILAEGLWMMSQGRNGRRAAWRGFAATTVTGAMTVAVKKTWRRRRPYPNDQKFGTFPSGHTSTVFAMATVMANASPRNKWLAYSSAAAVGWSRIKVRAHHPHDVLAGALLGYYVGKKFAPRESERINAPIANINFKF